MADRPRLIVWAELGQQDLLSAVAREANLELLAIASPHAREATELRAALDVEHVHDLRQAIQRDDVDVLWLAGRGPLEPDEARLIRARGLRTFSSEPRPLTVADVMARPEEAETAHFVPLMRSSPGFRSALDALEEIGAPECINVCFGAAAMESSLFARLFDAMDLLDAMSGPVERIDASLAGPRDSGQNVPETLGALRGHLTANVRLRENCAASIAVTDQAGSWFRQVTIAGKNSSLHITDHGHEWLGPEGQSIRTGEPTPHRPAGEVIGQQIARVLGQLDAASTVLRPDTPKLLALCEAARLSSRTRQGETPQRVLEMLSRL